MVCWNQRLMIEQCASDQTCNSGTCECEAGNIFCNGQCVSNNDPNTCGSCTNMVSLIMKTKFEIGISLTAITVHCSKDHLHQPGLYMPLRNSCRLRQQLRMQLLLLPAISLN